MTISAALLFFSALAAAAADAPQASPAPAATLHRERIEWADIWFTDAEKDALPRVLLVGDSITRGYFDGVEKELAGKAYCGQLCTSRSVCDPVFFQELKMILSEYKFSVVHFNNGLHGWDYTEDEYRAGFQKLVETLKAEAPGAKLICATTTPVQEKGGMKDHATRVPARNQAATEICTRAAIPLDDLFTLVTGKTDWYSGDGVHFNDAGRAAEAKQVAENIAKAL